MSEQPTPIPNNEPHVIDAAIELIESRRELGRQRYGTPLQVGNGRDFGRDADEEMADWIIYWAGYREEHARKMHRLEAIERAAREVAETDWRTSVSESEHYRRIGKMDRLREELAK